ncbi:hypothetical protein AGMMS49992_25640 [Clostridia bacterium]|nr:hypothetical protein AGMMS49992_25640 [Clostridia bacterium]
MNNGKISMCDLFERIITHALILPDGYAHMPRYVADIEVIV